MGRFIIETEMLIYSAIIGFVVALVILIADKLKKRDISVIFRHVMTALCIIYLLYLLTVTVFLREGNFEVKISSELIPFRNLYRIFKNKTYRELIEVIANILVFVPYGFLLKSIMPKKKYLPIALGAITTVSIEIIQYFSKRGVFDVNDMINNLIGVLIGYGVYLLLKKTYQKIIEKKRLKELMTGEKL